MPEYRYVGWETARVFNDATTNRKADKVVDLLWGDRVEVLGQSGGRTKIRARGRDRVGFVDKEALTGQSLLEIYFIDVGQGDGILIVLPEKDGERRHIMIDGGYPRSKQNTGKSAADFVDWKFFHDYAEDVIRLDAIICSHNDQDHYGGLADLLDTSQEAELDCSGVTVESFLHAGLSWWRTPSKRRTLGRSTKSGQRSYFTDLLTTRVSAVKGLKSTANPQFQGEWAKFIEKVTKTKKRDGTHVPFRRLSQNSGELEEFSSDGLGFTVLGPVEHQTSNGPGLRKLTSATSQNTNGHSVLLKIVHDHARILLTGDLNKRSQRVLLDEYAGRETEFLVDVAKACHHGSDDVSFEFLAALKPAVTVISSGDAEGHDHPRPSIIGASGTTGFLTVRDDEILTPLVYSTELARSVSLGDPNGLEVPVPSGGRETIVGNRFRRTKIAFEETKPGALRPEKRERFLGNTSVVAGQVYGLVNVRTDGKRILCATMNEGDGGWQTKTLEARF